MSDAPSRGSRDSVFSEEVRTPSRLEALRGLDALDVSSDEAFGRLTRLSKDVFGVEVAFVALLDTDRQWLESAVGLCQTDACLAASLCPVVIEEEGPYVIEDVAVQKWIDESCTGEAGSCFYAGVPIRAAGGEAIGTFSLMGRASRSFSEKERGRLEDFGQMVSQELRRRRETHREEEGARRFEAFLEDPDMLVGVLGPDGTLLEVNETARRYMEEGAAEVLGTPFWETPWWTGETREKVRAWVEEAAAGEYVARELDLQGPEGQRYRVEGKIRPVSGEAGGAEALIVSARDVTERKRRQDERRRLSKAVAQANETVLITEAEPLEEPGPRIVYVNDAFEEQTGYSKEEALGKTPRLLQGPDTDQEVMASIREALKAGDEWEGETVNYRKDGEPYRVRWEWSPVRGAEGAITHWVSVQRDVTEKRDREEELRRQKSLLAQAQRLAGAWEVDLRTGDVFWSEKVYEIHDLDPEVELGLEEAFEFLEPGARSRARTAFERCAEEGVPYDVELPMVTASGDQRWVRAVGAPAETDGDNVTKVAGALQDITERKTRERSLRKRQEKIEAIYAAANQLLEASGEEEVAEVIVELVHEMLGYPGVSVRLAQDEQLVPIRVSQTTTEFMPRRPVFDVEGESAVAEVYRTGESLVVEDLEATELQDPYDYGDLRAVVVVPMGKHGTFAVAAPEPGAISAFDTHLIEVLGTYATAVLDRVAQEEALSGTKNFYEQVLKQVPIDLAVFSPEAAFEYLNPQSVSDPERRAKILGWTNEEYFRERGFDPAVGRRRDKAIRKAARDKTQTELEETLETEEGPRHYLRVHGPVSDTDGTVTHVAAFGLEITEEKERRQKLEEYREYTDRLLNASEDLFFVVGPDGRLRRWNDQVASVTGYDEEELRKKDVLGFFPEAENERVRAAISEIFETGRSKVETILLTKKGEQVPYEFAGNLARHPDGDLRLVGIGRDITERKRREKALRKRGRRLEQIRKNVTDVIWMSPADKSEIEFISESYQDIWGRSPEEARTAPSSIMEAIHPEDRERVSSAMEIQNTRPEEYEQTYRVVQPSGEVRWVRDRAAGIYDEEGHLERIVGVATDITEKKRHELKLETVNTRLQLALESSETGTFDWNMETDEVIWDEVSERLFGYEPGEFPERYEAWADRIHPEDLAKAERHIERAIKQEETYDVEFRVEGDENASGPEERWVRARGDVKYDEDGTPVRMIGLHTDVTARKRREQELIEAKEEAEEASRLKSAVLANMSHEIRTPLTSVIGFGEVLEQQATGEAADLAGRIRRSGKRLMQTLDSVLQLSRLEAGAYEMEWETLDLSRLARETVELFRGAADEKGVRLQVEIPEDQLRGTWNEGALNRLLENLIENAIKFTPEEETVCVRVRQEGPEAVVEVEDTGVGISEEALPHIFEPFKQESEGLGRGYEGTGLGLPIVQRLVGAQGGSIEVDPEKEEGTCMTVRLPREQAESHSSA